MYIGYIGVLGHPERFYRRISSTFRSSSEFQEKYISIRFFSLFPIYFSPWRQPYPGALFSTVEEVFSRKTITHPRPANRKFRLNPLLFFRFISGPILRNSVDFQFSFFYFFPFDASMAHIRRRERGNNSKQTRKTRTITNHTPPHTRTRNTQPPTYTHHINPAKLERFLFPSSWNCQNYLGRSG